MILVQNHRQPSNGNKLKICFLIPVLVFFLVSGNLMAQEEVKVNRSKVIEKIDGKKYYIHEIKKGQTVYSIAKAYNVTTEQIYMYNPDAKEMVQPSQMLKIPVDLVEKNRELQREDTGSGIKHQQEQKVVTNDKILRTDLSGRKIILHEVQPKETLYSLSREYGTTVKAIKNLNPGLVDILEKGQKIKIPTKKKLTIVQTTDNLPDSIRLYKVKKGETLYRIALDHNIEVEDIIKLNPGVAAKGLKAGSIIKLPKKSREAKDAGKYADKGTPKDGFLKHKVKPGETLYSLSMRYAIGIEELKKHNPILKDGLKSGQILNIPVDKKKREESALVLPGKKILDSLAFIKQEDTTLVPCDSIDIKRKYKIALFIPLNLDHSSEIRVKNYYSEGWPEQKFTSFAHIHYYEGFLLALDSLEKSGMSAEIVVYDTKASPAHVSNIVAKPSFKTFDLVFGPFDDKALDIVVDEAMKYSINVISPVSYDMSSVNGHPNLIKLFPPANYQIDQIIDFVAEHHKLKNIVFVYSSEKEKNLLKSSLQPKLAIKLGIRDSIYPWKVINYETQGYSAVISSLSKEKSNLLFCMHKGEAKINRFITRLNGKREDYDITVLGSNKWEAYQSIESKYLNNLKYTTFTDFLIDYDDIRVKKFVREFTDRYKTWPHQDAFKGFDAGYYFLNALFNYGVNFQYCMNNIDVFTMHNDFTFKQWESNAWQNYSLNIYQYRDYKRVNLVRDFKTPGVGELSPQNLTKDKPRE